MAIALKKSADLEGWAIEAKRKPLKSRVKKWTVVKAWSFSTTTLSIWHPDQFSNPSCNWQRGSNENFKGLVRQYIPKKRHIETVIDEELTTFEN